LLVAHLVMKPICPIVCRTCGPSVSLPNKKSIKTHLPPRPGVGSWRSTTKCQHSFWRPTHADNTSRDSRPQVTRLESLRDGFLEHAVLVDGGHPVGVSGGVVVASTVPVALDERPRSEILETRSWRRKGLSGPIRTSVSMHDEAVAFPQVVPVFRALRHIHVLGVHCHCFSWGFTDSTL